MARLARQGSLYAAAAIAGTSLYLLLVRVGLPRPTAALAGMAVVAGLRLAAIWWGLRLPVFEVRTSELPVPPRSERSSSERGSG